MGDLADDPSEYVHDRVERAAKAMRTGDESHQPSSGAPAAAGAANKAVRSAGDLQGGGDASGRDAAQNPHDRIGRAISDRCADSLSLIERIFGSPDDEPAIRDSFDDSEWRDRLERWFNPDFDEIVPDGVDAPALPDTVPAPADNPGAAPGAVDTDTAKVAPDSVISVDDGGIGSRGTPQRDATTDLPSNGIPMQMPAGAPVAPSAPNSGHAGHGNADGAALAATFGSGNAMDARSADMAACGTSQVPLEPGRQPGVTPD